MERTSEATAETIRAMAAYSRAASRPASLRGPLPITLFTSSLGRAELLERPTCSDGGTKALATRASSRKSDTRAAIAHTQISGV